MKTWLKRTWVGGGAVCALVVVAAVVGMKLGDRKLDRRIELDIVPVAFRDDAAGVARGEYLFRSRGCADCHGPDGHGRLMVDDGHGLLIRSPNLTPGRGSAVAAYAPVDWVRTIRHGVKPSGRPLFLMPSEEFNRMTDDDLSSLVGHVRRLAPVDGLPGRVELSPLVKVLYAVGKIPMRPRASITWCRPAGRCPRT